MTTPAHAAARVLAAAAFSSSLACSMPAAAEEANDSGTPLDPAQAAVDVRHVDLALEVDPGARSISGTCTTTLRIVAPTAELLFQLDGRLTVDAVRVEGRPAEFEHANGAVRIPFEAEVSPGTQVAVSIDYGGRPRVAPRPPWEGGFTWAETADGAPWIATSCQGEGADLWWPCKDHPSDEPETMSLTFTVPEDLVVATNGVQVREEHDAERGTRTTHWRVSNPINNYGVAFNAAPYQVLEAELESVAGEVVPVRFWVLPESVEKARPFLDEILDHLAFYEDVCGPYPFRNEKYGVVETPHLGMEHQTIIAYGNEFKQGEFDYDWLHHHELSHEWWANLVTCSDWKDMWIHEGIGTYMQALYLERKFGAEAYAKQMEDHRAKLNNRRPVAPRESRSAHEVYFGPDGRSDADIYYKGSWVVHSLRWLVGDEAFFGALRRLAYPDPALERVTGGGQTRFSDTEEIRAILERETGRELGWFFEVYLRRPELPGLTLERVAGGVELAWKTPDDLPFPMPIEVVVDGERRRVEMPDGRARLDVRAGGEVVLDPERRVLRR